MAGIDRVLGASALGTLAIEGSLTRLQAEDVNALNVIHIAGTKGKGSTCAFTESFLRAHGQRTGFPCKTGLYTSPHMVLPEERIRIDSKPLDHELFAKYFFELFDKLPQLAVEYSPEKSLLERGPRTLQLYALLAFHAFIREKVDVAIFETHSGGEYDATNVIEKPVVTAVTTLGMDHIDTLGPTIQDIAWHKSGIFKSGAVALSTFQDTPPAIVLQDRAKAKGIGLQFVDEGFMLPQSIAQLEPMVQRKNALLAAGAARAWLARSAPGGQRALTDEDLSLGVKQWFWPGRFQFIPDGERTWFLDAAHNDMSVKVAAQWYVESGRELDGTAGRILIFSHISDNRDASAVLRSLATELRIQELSMNHVIFSTYSLSVEPNGPSAPDRFAHFDEVWKEVFPSGRIWHEPSVKRAVELARKLSIGSGRLNTQVLVTGSQHLVGSTLQLLSCPG